MLGPSASAKLSRFCGLSWRRIATGFVISCVGLLVSRAIRSQPECLISLLEGPRRRVKLAKTPLYFADWTMPCKRKGPN